VCCWLKRLYTISVTVLYQTLCKHNDIKHHKMKTSAELEVNLHAVLTLAVDKSEQSASRCGRFTSDKHCITGTRCTTAGLDKTPGAIQWSVYPSCRYLQHRPSQPLALARTRSVQWPNISQLLKDACFEMNWWRCKTSTVVTHGLSLRGVKMLLSPAFTWVVATRYITWHVF
jgi:hypothetical protein